MNLKTQNQKIKAAKTVGAQMKS